MPNRTRKLKQGGTIPVVPARTFFENTHTARPTINLTSSVRPTVLPMSNMFPGPKTASPFNMSPKNLRLHNRQVKAFNASKSGNYVMPMNHSQGGTGGKRTRKQKRNKRK